MGLPCKAAFKANPTSDYGPSMRSVLQSILDVQEVFDWVEVVVAPPEPEPQRRR